jgi:hypothetical protein
MAESVRNGDAQTQAGRLYEGSDIDARRVSFFGAGLAGLIIVVMILTYFIHEFVADRYFTRQPPRPSLAYMRAAAPEPHLTVQAPEELRRLRASEEATLNGYAWVDKESGVVRIPIERAMELVAKRGLPARGETDRNQKTRNVSRKDAKAQR